MTEYQGEHEADTGGGSKKDAIAPTIRTAIYLGSLALAFLSFLVFGLLGVFDVISGDQAGSAIAVVNGAISVLAPLIASVYRPTRPDALNA